MRLPAYIGLVILPVIAMAICVVIVFGPLMVLVSG
jgi:hypothetical protein